MYYYYIINYYSILRSLLFYFTFLDRLQNWKCKMNSFYNFKIFDFCLRKEKPRLFWKIARRTDCMVKINDYKISIVHLPDLLSNFRYLLCGVHGPFDHFSSEECCARRADKFWTFQIKFKKWQINKFPSFSFFWVIYAQIRKQNVQNTDFPQILPSSFAGWRRCNNIIAPDYIMKFLKDPCIIPKN